jgi:hypothetical protein
MPDGMPTPGYLKSPPNPARLMGNVAAFERLLAHDRNARVVWAHGGSDFTGNMTAVPAYGLQVRNTIVPAKGIAQGWLSLLTRHPDRFVLGADAFFLAASTPPETPPDLANKIAVANATRLYRL